ncbi:E3 ubiquitin-protein ligase Ubr3 [Frankliniella occidentalis]|uniref:E3 ubiquitin-protein ligase n=1 Tax=Frankliniella occidentalis TaxID=133901 RepID=A0A6J1SBT8_FRAOC|nr:E3 ubiquitin-protein ligase Ubr3 [Frankliniella occidentalis]
MDPLPSPTAQAIMKKGKRAAAEYVHKDCCSNHSQRLNEILDILLNPTNNIDDWETIDWCRWLVAGGHTPDEFTNIVRQYDNASMCGLVWTANFVAYRCRTCGISPCMSLCLECFQKGNHINHDFNMFRSQAGGACDCGDTNVMKEMGFCSRHGPQAQANKPNAPIDLLNVAEAMMPRVFLRLIQYFRDSSVVEVQSAAVQDADLFLSMLVEFSSLGAAMRRVMANTLTNPQVYKNLTQCTPTSSASMRTSAKVYEAALDTLLNPDPPEEFEDCIALQKRLVHHCFLEELMFWNIKFEFPQKMVCLLLNLLPEPDYKEALTQALVLHYSRISLMLERSSDPDSMSNRVVHMSVQLFSNQQLAMSMADNYDLLHVMTFTLKYMMSKLLIQNTLHEPEKNFHYVVDCGVAVMKEHCYWPLVSDLNNVLSHRSVALKFMGCDSLLEMWFVFLSMFQGMNVNQREMTQHIEFEPNTYYAAFSAELEACAYPMWALLSHLREESTLQYSKRVIASCLTALQEWLDAINFRHPIEKDKYQVSFHLSLHRYLAVFMCQAIRRQGLALRDVLPPSDVLQLIMFHPLRVQAAFYEIVSGLWVRNGLQIKGQAMTYIQCNFCNSMVDADLYLLQVCATQLQPETFLTTVLDQFHMKDWLSLATFTNPQHLLDSELETPMLESCLLFLATLVSIRNYLGDSEASISELEMGTLLCMGDKTHSQLIELMPEKCYPFPQSRDFESILAEVADYRAPNFESSGNMQQGMYRPKGWIWDKLYNPIHVLLRAVHRRDFQNSMDRFTEYVHQTGKFKGSGPPWPPYRMPGKCHPAYDDPRKVLQSRVFHAFAFIVLHKAVHGHDVSDHVIALTLYLLEMALSIESPAEEPSQVCQASRRREQHVVKDGDLMSWYDSDWLSSNLRTVVHSVMLNMDQTSYDSSESEWGSLSLDGGPSPAGIEPGPHALALEQSQAPKRYPIVPLSLTIPPALTMIAGSSSSQAGAFSLPALPQPGVGDGTMEVESPASPDEVAELVSGESEASASEGGCLALVSGGRSTEDDDSSGEGEITHSMSLAVVGDMTVVSTEQAGLDTEVVPVGMQVMQSVPSSSSRHVLAVGSSGMPAASSSGSNMVALGVQAVEPAPSSSGHSEFYKKKHKKQGSDNVHVPMRVNESIISLLLKLHSNLTETPDSFDPYEVERKAAQASGQNEDQANDYIGDGPFFVGKLLKHIMSLDPMCRDTVFHAREKLWGKKPEVVKDVQRMREDEEREERRRRAKERQKKLMEEFASQQKQFMAMAMETDENGMDWEEEETASMVSKKEYDCAICNQTTLSTAENPMGLVVLLQPTSVLGHRRSRKEFVLPTNDEDQALLKIKDKLSDNFDRRVELLSEQFDDLSWQLSVNLGWEGGVHLQTCGHHLHLECHKSYLQSLKNQQRQQQSLDVDHGEYSCPICRQLANSVLPLSPELGECSAMVRSRPASSLSIVSEISHLLLENPLVVRTSTLPEAMGKLMEDMTNCTSRKYKQKSTTTTHQSLFLFVASIARTNLELELVQRGGNLCTDLESINSPLTPKRSCIVPLLHVLAIHARCLAVWPVSRLWQQLAGVEIESDTTALAALEKEVPLLLRDPTAILLQLVLLLPLHIDETYFLCVVKVLYNLLYFQVLAQIACRLSDRERHVWRAAFENKQPSLHEVTTLEAGMALTIRLLEPSQIFLETSEVDSASSQSQPSSGYSQPVDSKATLGVNPSSSAAAPSTSSMESEIPPMIFLHRRSVVRVDDPDSPLEPLSEQEQNILLNKKALENEVQQLCLPFLRIAALLRHHLYEQPLPEIQDENSEFVRLVYYLDLVSEGMNLAKFNSAVVLSWPAEDPGNPGHMPPKDWAEQLIAFARNAQMTARAFLLDHHKLWRQPRLLSLPQVYDGIFQYYLRRQCVQCHSVPRETTLCLLCGTLVCFKENCCQQSEVCEAVQHAEVCGAGTAVFLVVTSSCIIVIRGKRACLWGSVYLDSFGEEDRELKRGKPLFLSPERYQLLQQQWLSHRFDHTNKKWVWHRDSL